jgi:hypothetical protein
MNLRKYGVAITMSAVVLWAAWFVFMNTVPPTSGNWLVFAVFHLLLLCALVDTFVAIAIRISNDNKTIIRRAVLLAVFFIVPLILQGFRCFNLLTLALLAVALILVDFFVDGKTK